MGASPLPGLALSEEGKVRRDPHPGVYTQGPSPSIARSSSRISSCQALRLKLIPPSEGLYVPEWWLQRTQEKTKASMPLALGRGGTTETRSRKGRYDAPTLLHTIQLLCSGPYVLEIGFLSLGSMQSLYTSHPFKPLVSLTQRVHPSPI